MDLLGNLTQFYKNEQRGIPHDDVALWNLGWGLATIIERYKLDDWKGISSDEEEQLAEMLRTSPDSALIDTAVNLLHWALLHSHAQGEPYDWEQKFKALGKDVVQYLLQRPN